MTESPTRLPVAGTSPWTCPFCPLLCDAFKPVPDESASGLRLAGSDCPRAQRALAHFGLQPAAAQPRLNGADCDLDAAYDAAAQLLARSRQPLFGGLATDVAGGRALYRLACETGAIADAAGGSALMHGLRPLQDRGAFTTTLAEVRTRADLIVCFGSPNLRYPELYRRCGIGEELVAARQVVSVGGGADALPPAGPRTQVESIPLTGDLHRSVSLLAALVAQRPLRAASPALAALAERLRAAHYAVLVYDTASLPPHGALIVEALNHIVGTLNQSTRAAALPLGGNDGSATVNQVFAWLSGLPLRSRPGPAGLEHEPLAFDAQRLLAQGSVDALLWVSSFGPEPAPPPTPLPQVLLGHPQMALPASASESVFIPVSTPGMGSAGHSFRVDGVVLMPLNPLYRDTLPTVAQAAGEIATRVARLRAQGAVQ